MNYRGRSRGRCDVDIVLFGERDVDWVVEGVGGWGRPGVVCVCVCVCVCDLIELIELHSSVRQDGGENEVKSPVRGLSVL